jgi:ribosomal protein L40E
MKPDFIIGGMTGEGPGAKRYSCTYCHTDAWIGPASIKLLKENAETKLICLACYVSNPKIPKAEECETSVSSHEELVEALGVEKADFLAKNTPKIISALKKKAAALEPWKRN